MKQSLCLLLTFMMFFAGCAGREANPIAIYLPGDENRSCTALKAEIAQLQVDMERLLPKTDKGVSNALWATAGVFLIVPFFFMDLKGSEQIEFDAMRRRHNRLLVYAAERSCDMVGVTAERIPSVEERKEAAKKGGTISTQKSEELIQCANCDSKIGKLEKAYVFRDEIVCAICYSKLMENPKIKSTAVESEIDSLLDRLNKVKTE